MGRRVSRAVRRVVRRAVRAVDSVTGDVLDLDGSKQKDAIEAMRKAEEAQIEEARKQQAQEEQYQQDVEGAKGDFQGGSTMVEDTTGVGLGNVQADFSGSKAEDDELKKVLKKIY